MKPPIHNIYYTQVGLMPVFCILRLGKAWAPKNIPNTRYPTAGGKKNTAYREDTAKPIPYRTLLSIHRIPSTNTISRKSLTVPNKLLSNAVTENTPEKLLAAFFFIKICPRFRRHSPLSIPLYRAVQSVCQSRRQSVFSILKRVQ